MLRAQLIKLCKLAVEELQEVLRSAAARKLVEIGYHNEEYGDAWTMLCNHAVRILQHWDNNMVGEHIGENVIHLLARLSSAKDHDEVVARVLLQVELLQPCDHQSDGQDDQPEQILPLTQDALASELAVGKAPWQIYAQKPQKAKCFEHLLAWHQPGKREDRCHEELLGCQPLHGTIHVRLCFMQIPICPRMDAFSSILKVFTGPLERR
mmetsp:Transcript_19484/g.36759  ORF Transcript_19484/g.36759 Transcript_19484/m.36759 type:complete len:209 (+) Transcript_19484:1671-2297(+)